MNARTTIGVSRPLWAGPFGVGVAASLRAALAFTVRVLDRLNGVPRLTETSALGIASSDLDQMQRVMVM